MNIILWGIFYLILTGVLLYFFVKEKVIVEWLKDKEQKIADKLAYNGDKKKFKTIADVITVIHLVMTGYFFYIIKQSGEDLDFPFKVKIIFGVFIINFIVLVLRKKQSWAFIINALLLVLGKMMIDIQGMNLYIFLALSCILFLAEIYLYQNAIYDSLHLIETSVTAVIIVLLIQNFYLGNFMIPTGSMRPTIIEGDRFFANMILYKFKEPKRGDIIAFKEPKDNKLLYTKRLVGLPGETLRIDGDGQLVINDNIVNMTAHLIGQSKKELMTDDKGLVVIKNNELDQSGQPVDETINFMTNEKGKTVTSDSKGNLSLDGQKLDMRVYYRQEGFLRDQKIYIPKKGDVVKLDKVLQIGSKPTENEQSYEWIFQEVPLDLFNQVFSGQKIEDYMYNMRQEKGFFTYTLKVKGRDEVVMGILDFKHDEKIMKKLLVGEEVTLEHDYYFAMGDNSSNSDDSRYWGYVQDSRIKGKLLFRFLPITKFGVVK